MAKVNPKLIVLTIDDVDRSGEVGKAEITSAASDTGFLTFDEARSGGGRDYALVMTVAQDHASSTLWSAIWDDAGDKVTGVYAPYGNEEPSESQPHYEFEAEIREPDGTLMGGEATTANRAVASIEVTWPLTSKPTKITTSPET